MEAAIAALGIPIQTDKDYVYRKDWDFEADGVRLIGFS